MKLDYIPNINEFGDNVVRLYEFDNFQAVRFRDAIRANIIQERNQLDLKSLSFVENRNCNLILRISDEDTGIITSDNENFICELTLEGYEHMLHLLEPFCKKDTKGYQWLYDIDTETDFLFSPAGTW